MALAYASTAAYREYALQDKPDAEGDYATASPGYRSDARIGADLEAASDDVDNICNRTFGPRVDTDSGAPQSATVEDFVVYGDGTSYLFVEGTCYVTTAAFSVKQGDADGTLVAAACYQPLLTRDHLGPDGVVMAHDATHTPRGVIYGLRLIDGRVWADGYPYTIHARRGCPGTPEPVKQAALEICAVRRGEGGRSAGGYEAGQGQVESTSPAVADTVQGYLARYVLRRR